MNTSYTLLRLLQILTLIPAWALCAAIIASINSNNSANNTLRVPGYIITLFVATLLACIWAFCILLTYFRARNTAYWIAFWDFVVMALLIAGVATTANTANYDCNAIASTSDDNMTVGYTTSGERVTVSTSSAAAAADTNAVSTPTWQSVANCTLVKAAWGLAIANVVLFFVTGIMSVAIARGEVVVVEEPVVEKVGGGHRRGERGRRTTEYVGPRRERRY